jgi:creatinine amidohydrolase
MRFGEMTAPEIRSRNRDQTLVVVPIAACEQHGPHLGVLTDTILATAVAEGLEARLPDQVLLLPTLWVGASEHHLPFGGTLTLTLPTYIQTLVELMRPLLVEGFRRVLILNGHGGNIDPLKAALRRLDAEFPGRALTGAAYWQLAEPELAALCEGRLREVGHACEIETSMMLHLRPDLVRVDLYPEDFDPTRAHLGRGRLSWPRDFGRATRAGSMGNPRLATADKGRRMLAAIIERVSATALEVLAVPLD